MEITKLIKKVIREYLFRDRPVDYLILRWDGVSDIELLTKIMGADPYNKELLPLELDFTKIKRALILSPHQDDESLGVGGTMLLLRQAQIPVEVYFTSDGGVLNPKFTDQDSEVPEIRFAEARKMAEYADVEMDILGIPDARPKPTVKHMELFAQKLWDNKDSAIFIPWLLDTPPKHRYLHHLLYLTDKHIGLPEVDLCQYQVHNSLIPSHFVDITSVIDKKRKCLEFYESQNTHLRPYDHLGVAMSGWNSRLVPSDKQALYAELFFKVSMKENLKLVEKFFFKDLNRTYRGHLYLIKGLQDLHHELKEYKGSSAVR